MARMPRNATFHNHTLQPAASGALEGNFKTPADLAALGVEDPIGLTIKPGRGCYVLVGFKGREVELPEEGNGEPGAAERITRYAMISPARYARGRVYQAIEQHELEEEQPR